jgi:glutaminyl-peptide cyclotransferase
VWLGNPDLKRRTARRMISPKSCSLTLFGALSLLLGSLSCSHRPVETLKVKVLSVRPHDPGAYTQGLLLHERMLYESTGRYGQSSLRRVDPQTGKVLQRVALPDGYFGEGLALQESRLVQLTWWENLAFVWTIDGFRPVGQFSYKGEAWGLCYDGEHFLMSDGTDTLTVRDPATFDVIDRIRVTLQGNPVTRLNELECVGNSVYANVYFTDTIVRIEKKTGNVTAVIDASGLLTPEERLGADVLNGIAHDPEKDSFLITGKLWPRLFEVRFVPPG